MRLSTPMAGKGVDARSASTLNRSRTYQAKTSMGGGLGHETDELWFALLPGTGLAATGTRLPGGHYLHRTDCRIGHDSERQAGWAGGGGGWNVTGVSRTGRHP